MKRTTLEAAAAFGAVCLTLSWAAPTGSSLPVLAAWALAVTLCTLVAFSSSAVHDLRTARSFGWWAPRLPGALGLALLPLAGWAVLPSPPVPPRAFFSSVLTASVLVLAVRATASRLRDRRTMERVLIVGSSRLAQELVKELQARPHLRQSVVGFIDEGADAPAPRCRRLGSPRDLRGVVEQLRPHRVIVALAARRGQMPLKTLLDLRLRDVIVEDGVEVYERLTGKIAIEALTPSSLIFCKDYRAFRLGLTLSRVLSLPAAAAVLLLLSPLLILVAVAIKLDSPGPVFFVQERAGRKGRLFRLIKFRTMHPARTATSEWARDNTTRLTRVGRWLRRFRLDELPQLVNVIKGDMNLVGPRPHPGTNLPLFVMVMRNTPECGEPIPYYALRSLVRPGITGWAQVRYRYANDLEEEIEKMRYDLYYIKHMSFWLDLRILFETVKIVFRGRELVIGDPGARRARAHSAAMRAARAPLRLAAEVPPPLELGLGLASAASVGSAVPASAASPAAGPALVEQDLSKA